jgi:hypothetical protein
MMLTLVVAGIAIGCNSEPAAPSAPSAPAAPVTNLTRDSSSKSGTDRYWDQLQILGRVFEEWYELIISLEGANEPISNRSEALVVLKDMYIALADAELVSGEVLTELERIDPPPVCQDKHSSVINMVSLQYETLRDIRVYYESLLRGTTVSTDDRERLLQFADAADIERMIGLVAIVDRNCPIPVED